MNEPFFTDYLSYDNILYIGDEAKVCLAVIEDFNNRLNEIENKYEAWFTSRSAINKPAEHDKLQYHIHYHFEGGIAVFKFKNEEDIPYLIRRECFLACKNLVEERLYYAS
jgi:hypothetical protein